MKYEIKGDTLPVVICHLEAGERMITVWISIWHVTLIAAR